jgi:hypothetical protein
MIHEKPTSNQGYHVRCDGPSCHNLVWCDTTHGYFPGPDFCGQGCYDAWWDDQTPDCTPPV